MADDTLARMRRLGHLVGNTPMIAVDLTFRGRPMRLFAKAEHLNMTGSVKDRMALHIMRRAFERGLLAPGATIAEATSGNTGISFAAIGRALGHPVTIFMPDWMSEERKLLIRSFGADVRLVSEAEGGFVGAIDRARAFAATCENCFLPEQFENADNVEAHERTTGPEILWQLRYEGREPDAFVAGVGTGGTVIGVGRYLRSQKPDVGVYPVEPANSPTLRTGYQVGHHRIQGISDEFVPAICDLGMCDGIASVDDGDAIIMAQRLAAELGLGVGISSGANLLAAIDVRDRLGEGATVVTVFPDDNKKYLSTALMREEPVKEGFLSSDVVLEGFTVLKRVCEVCCDGEECERADAALASGGPLPEWCPKRT